MSLSRRRVPARSRLLLVPLLALCLTALVGCDSGSDEDPAGALAAAKQALDETSGVTLSLTTGKLPGRVDGIPGGDGLATHAPAFDGDLTVVVNGLTWRCRWSRSTARSTPSCPSRARLRRGEPRGLRRPGPGPAHGPGHRPLLLAHRGDRHRGRRAGPATARPC